MKRIIKKCLSEYYQAVRTGRKTFEIRQDDSFYEVGDILELREWDGKKYTGHKLTKEITYILRDVPEYGLKKGYCILGIRTIGWDGTACVSVVQNGENNKVINNTGNVTFYL